jgi:hypothetical protein|tara:strand:- start:2563 stop:2829 length:267 start_codon:yes stop_codon:yes gene_type:complete
MKFIVAVNETEELPDGTKGSVTFDHIETGTTCRRTNRKHLHAYLMARGVPKQYVKQTMKRLGFDNAALGPTQDEIKKMLKVKQTLKSI